jgi:hypothetical protein
LPRASRSCGGSGRQRNAGRSPTHIPPPTLAEAGIDKHLADLARKLAALPEETFTQRITG